MSQSALPRAAPDSTLSVLRNAYSFIGEACDRLGTDGFRTRILLRDVVCLRGAEAAALLYEAEGLTRQGAMPGWVMRLLQDKGSVQQMEGAAHRQRKAVFMQLCVDSDADADLAARFGALWADRAPREGGLDLLHDTSAMLARAAGDWCGLSPELARDPEVAEALFRMSDRTGRPGPAAWAALWRRRRVERRIADEVRHQRARGTARADSPLAIFAGYQEDGALLTPEVVAVELLNLLRPIVAVGRYIAFAGRHLLRQPDWRDRLRGDPALIPAFCEEVRRTSPFFPFTAAIATAPVRWNGVTLPKGQWILADIYGTCHQPALFPDPDAFRPERGLDWRDPAPGFVPQGAGRTAETHRCPGEKITVALMAEAVSRLVAGEMTAPVQDLSTAWRPVPAQPASGVRVRFG